MVCGLLGKEHEERVFEFTVFFEEGLDADLEALVVVRGAFLFDFGLAVDVPDSPEGEVLFVLAVLDFLLEEVDSVDVGLPLVAIEVHLLLDLNQSFLDVLLHLLEVFDFHVVLLL